MALGARRGEGSRESAALAGTASPSAADDEHDDAAVSRLRLDTDSLVNSRLRLQGRFGHERCDSARDGGDDGVAVGARDAELVPRHGQARGSVIAVVTVADVVVVVVVRTRMQCDVEACGGRDPRHTARVRSSSNSNGGSDAAESGCDGRPVGPRTVSGEVAREGRRDGVTA